MVDQTEIIVTAAEYLALPETSQRTELIDGRVITYGDGGVSPAPKLTHQRLVVRLVALLTRIVPDGEVYTAPTDCHLDDTNIYQPDVFWVAENSQATAVDDKFIQGPPDLVIEVLSKGTAKQDKIKKYRAYQAAGVREYWIADPEERYIEIYRLRDDRFELLNVVASDEKLTSPILNQTIELEAIFRI